MSLVGQTAARASRFVASGGVWNRELLTGCHLVKSNLNNSP